MSATYRTESVGRLTRWSYTYNEVKVESGYEQIFQLSLEDGFHPFCLDYFQMSLTKLKGFVKLWLCDLKYIITHWLFVNSSFTIADCSAFEDK